MEETGKLTVSYHLLACERIRGWWIRLPSSIKRARRLIRIRRRVDRTS